MEVSDVASRSIILVRAAAVGASAATLLAALVWIGGSVTGQAQGVPTPYHEGQPSPDASPRAMEPILYPLPAATDRPTGDMMAAGGAAMVAAADEMGKAAGAMLGYRDPELVSLGRHWQQDAEALASRGAWMVGAATAGSMVHDPARAREINLQGLLGNGMSMAAEGEAMAQHGEAMATEGERLRQEGAIPAQLADDLAATASMLVTAGQALESDGQRMQDQAESLLRSIGQ